VTGGVIVSKGQIQLITTGVNRDLYILPQQILEFAIVTPILGTPAVTQIGVTNSTLTTVNILIGTSEICQMYYMYALAGTLKPNFTELLNGGPPAYTTQKATYGIITVGASNIVILRLTGLVAQTAYVLHLQLVNRQGTIDPGKTFNFATNSRYSAADFTLRFKQSYLNSAEKQLAINAVAYVLSLPPIKVQEKKYTLIARRRLQEEPERRQKRQLADVVTTTLDLQIITVPESDVYLSPVQLVGLLSTKKDVLASMLSNFDTSYLITGTSVLNIFPGFPTPPAIIAYDQTSVTITSTLDNYGWVFAVAVLKSEDLGKPSSYQIWNGLDFKNKRVPNGSVEVTAKFEAFTFKITSLTNNTGYNLYIVAGSAHPGYPDLNVEKNIVFLELTTLDYPPGTTLKLFLHLMVF
jgi:hypothetical protein